MSFIDMILKNIPPEVIEQLTNGGREMQAVLETTALRLSKIEVMINLMNENVLAVHKYNQETRKMILDEMAKNKNAVFPEPVYMIEFNGATAKNFLDHPAHPGDGAEKITPDLPKGLGNAA